MKKLSRKELQEKELILAIKNMKNQWHSMIISRLEYKIAKRKLKMDINSERASEKIKEIENS